MEYHRDGGRFFNRLPIEVWLEILYLIPVRSLMVLRTVSKSFLSIINDSDFVSPHLQNFPKNRHETQLFAIQRDSYQIFQITTSDETLIRVNERADHLHADTHWHLKGSLDGILLLKDDASKAVRLWNPSIRSERQVPLPASKLKHLGLGYESSRRDYKVVAMSSCQDRAWVYSIKTGSWVEILDSGFVCRLGALGYSPSLSFKDGVFWIEHSEYRGGQGVYMYRDRLVWFDFVTERFRYANEVPYLSNKNDCSGLLMLDGGSSVGVWGFDAERNGSIWALETETMSWTSRYKIVRDALPWSDIVDRARLVERNGELVLKYWVCMAGSLKSLSYKIETDEIECIKFSGVVKECHGTYIESLITLN